MAIARTRKEHEVAKALIETKAIDFEKVGSVIASHGAEIALSSDGEDNFCWTMRTFIRLLRPGDPGQLQIGDLQQLAQTIRG